GAIQRARACDAGGDRRRRPREPARSGKRAASLEPVEPRLPRPVRRAADRRELLRSRDLRSRHPREGSGADLGELDHGRVLMAYAARGADPWGAVVLRRVVADLKKGWPAGLTVLTGDDLYHLDRAQRAILEHLAPASGDPFGVSYL